MVSTVSFLVSDFAAFLTPTVVAPVTSLNQILNDATNNIIGDALLFNTIPYDPGSLESISHSTATHLKSNGVSSVHFGGLIHANPYDPGPIGSPSLTTVSYNHVFQFSIPMCYIVSPIVSVGVFFWIRSPLSV